LINSLKSKSFADLLFNFYFVVLVLGLKLFQINIVLFSLFTSYLAGTLPSALFGAMIVNGNNLFSGFSEQETTLLFGMIMAAYGLGQLAGSPVLGSFSDRIGRKFILLCSLFLSACGYLTIITAIVIGNIYLFILGRFIIGFSDGNVAVLTSIASNLTDDKKTQEKYLSLTNVIGNVGWLIGPLVGAVLSDLGMFPSFDYITAFVFSLILVIINIALVIFGVNKDKPSKLEKLKIIKISTFKPQVALITCIHFSLFLIFIYMPYYYVKKFALSLFEISICIGLVSIVMIIAGIAHSKYSNRYRSLFSTTLGFMLTIISLCLTSYSSSIYFTICYICVFSIGATLLECNTIIMFSGLTSEESQGKVIGVYRGIAVLMGVLSSISIGYVSSFNLENPLILSIIAGVAGFVIYISQKSHFGVTAYK
jgi:DHA1 family tetracycline resistance protein-like MFS transporter